MRTLIVFLIIMISIFLIASPAMASVLGLFTSSGDGSYYLYDYQDLLDSYALALIGKPNGLFEDYNSKNPVAFLHSSGIFIDYNETIDYYAATVINGQSFNFCSFVQSARCKKFDAPSSFSHVSISQGQLSSQKINDRLPPSLISTTPTPVQSATDTKNSPATPSNAGNNAFSEGIPIVAPSQVSLTRALEWAEGKNAHPRFIDIAPIYWEYGRLTGICPEVLYAQAAHETRYGHFTGQVPPFFNNWAGIKTENASGDRPEDHQQFATPEDGVRAHFNHMSAYVGLHPIGEPHSRYYIVKRLPWSGTIATVDELSGKWAPSAMYHQRIVVFLTEMKQ